MWCTSLRRKKHLWDDNEQKDEQDKNEEESEENTKSMSKYTKRQVISNCGIMPPPPEGEALGTKLPPLKKILLLNLLL